MTRTEIIAILPLMVLAAAPVVIMLVIAFYRHHLLTAALTLLGLIMAFAMLPVASFKGTDEVTALLIVDSYGLFYVGLIFAAAFAVAALSYRYLEGREGNHEEFYLLLLIATLGSAVLVTSNHFISFFLGLEILSVSLYSMIAYLRVADIGIEAGIKYLILSGVSSAFLLFGMALAYAQLGTMEFDRIGSLRAIPEDVDEVVLLVGVGMMVIGIGFKLAVVPFHMWTPDVYQGAPAPVTAFVSTVSKGGMFALLLRFFTQIDYRGDDSLFYVFSAIAIASMVAGNVLALLQDNVKRILAYSSISHLGYLLVAFLATDDIDLAGKAVTFYLVGYFIALLGSFGIVTVLSSDDRDAESIDDYRGLFWRQPWLAVIFTGMLLSLAGLPVTAGFVGKFYIVTAGVGSALWALVVVLVLTSAVGLFYYLRIVAAMYAQPPVEAAEASAGTAAFSLADLLVLGTLGLLTVWLGVYPSPLIHMIQTMGQ